MTKREFLDTVFALAPSEANAIMDAFDEYVESNEPHWIPVAERLPLRRKQGGHYCLKKRQDRYIFRCRYSAVQTRAGEDKRELCG